MKTTLLTLGGSLLALSSLQAKPEAPIDFHTDVAPILREYCAGCHNDLDEDGGFSVETFAALMNGDSIVPGKSVESLFFHTVARTEEPFMPPEEEPQLNAEQVALLKRWIDAGAPGPEKDESILARLHVPDVPSLLDGPEPITALAVSPDGKLSAVARYQSISLVNPATGEFVRELNGLPGKVNAVHFSADGDKLIAATGIAGLKGVAMIWEVATGKELGAWEAHADILYDAELSPDGKILATASWDERIMLRNAETGKLIRIIKSHNGAVHDLAFSPDGSILASASGDETVKLWRVSDGTRLDTLSQPQGEQYSVTFSPDGKYVLAGGADNRIRLWEVISRKEPKINPLLEARFAHEDSIVSLALSPDGSQLVSASADGSVKLWSLPDLQAQRIWEDQPDLITGMVFTSASEAVASHINGSMSFFSGLTPNEAKASGSSGQSLAKSIIPEADQVRVYQEIEPNQAPGQAIAVETPAQLQGRITVPGDVDLYRFSAREGEEWVIEVRAARDESPLDSRVAILNAQGEPVQRVLLQAVRDSWFTFRGKNSTTSNDFRIHNWKEMELNEYLYAKGEVVKLWLYPRGPDSGFKVYPGYDNRHGFFGTTPLSHALGEPAYIVRPHPPGTELTPNGLPTFPIFYENDDQSQQKWGADSHLIFKAPADGDYHVLITDVRGEGSLEHVYQMDIRPRQEDFRMRFDQKELKVAPGSGQEFSFKVDRMDDFEGEIQVDFSNVPDGLEITTPITIQPKQSMAHGAIYAEAGLDGGDPAELAKQIKVKAIAEIRGETVSHNVAFPGKLTVTDAPKLTLEILPDDESVVKVPEDPNAPLEFTLAPGETITALARATRHDFKDRIELGKEDAGRNFPHGVFVDNIGLNGLLIRENETDRQFFITATEWVPEGSRRFHLRTGAAGGQVSRPAILHIRKKPMDQGLAGD